MGYYDDIIRLPRHCSEKRMPMTLHDRAAQFAPFAALTGYDAAIGETARRTDKKAELDEETANILNERIHLIRERIGEKPEVEIAYFVPDERKSGGKYTTFKGRVRRIDAFAKVLIFTDGSKIPLADIISIENI